MGLTSLLLSLIGLLLFFLLFSGGIGMVISFPMAVLGFIFGIIGAVKKDKTATAGLVFSIIVILLNVAIYFIAFHGRVKLF